MDLMWFDLRKIVEQFLNNVHFTQLLANFL